MKPVGYLLAHLQNKLFSNLRHASSSNTYGKEKAVGKHTNRNPPCAAWACAVPFGAPGVRWNNDAVSPLSDVLPNPLQDRGLRIQVIHGDIKEPLRGEAGVTLITEFLKRSSLSWNKTWFFYSKEAFSTDSPFFLFFFNFFFLNWSIVDWQGCVTFRCPAKWFSYLYIYVFFFRFFSIIGYYKILSIVPCAIQ